MNERYWRAGREDAIRGHKKLDSDFFVDSETWQAYSDGYDHWKERCNGLVH